MNNQVEKVLKTEYRFFTPADFREEQAYLELRHRQGWAFLGVKRFKYSFGLAPKKNMTYERDFKEDDIFIDDYISMYSKDGWEFVYRTDDNYYFRKADVVYPEEKEVFSTYYERAQHFSKTHMRLMSDTFVVVLVALFWVLAAAAAGSFAFTTFVDVLAVIIGFLLLLSSSAVLFMLYLKYKNLKAVTLTEAEKEEAEQVAEEETLGAKALETAVKKAEEADAKTKAAAEAEAKTTAADKPKKGSTEVVDAEEVQATAWAPKDVVVAETTATKAKPKPEKDNSASVILAAQEKRKSEEEEKLLRQKEAQKRAEEANDFTEITFESGKGKNYSFGDTLTNKIK